MPDRPHNDPAEHALDFAGRHAPALDRYCAERMEDLGIPAERIGSSDQMHGIPWCAFNPHEVQGGGVTPDGRVNFDSGVLNPRLMGSVAPGAGEPWAGARLRDRIDASIAHEFEEGDAGGNHDLAVERCPDTALPIRDEARELARKIGEAARGR